MSDAARALPWANEERALVTELQSGSAAAFDWLVTHFHGPVFNVVFGILNDSADAADVTQDVFLKAFRGIRSFRHSSSLKTWLYRIAIREALNHKRWWFRHRRWEAPLDGGPGEASPALSVRDLGASPFDQLAAQEVQQVVHRALAEVPPVFRTAVILRDLEGMSYEEVAEVLEVSVGTVKSRILRGRRFLREVLKPVLANRPPRAALEPAFDAAAPLPSSVPGGGVA